MLFAATARTGFARAPLRLLNSTYPIASGIPFNSIRTAEPLSACRESSRSQVCAVFPVLFLLEELVVGFDLPFFLDECLLDFDFFEVELVDGAAAPVSGDAVGAAPLLCA